MKVFKSIFIFTVFAAVSVSCSLLHFFPPAAQNLIQQMADKKGWVLVGTPLSNILISSVQFSFDVDGNGKPFIALVDLSNNLAVYANEGSWVLKSKLPGVGTSAKPVLHFIKSCPNVAIQLGNSRNVMYDFCGDPPQISGGYFASNALIFDFDKDNSDMAYTTFQTNNGAMNLFTIAALSSNGSWSIPVGFTPVSTSFPLSYLKMDFAFDKCPYLLWNTNSSYNITYQRTDNTWANKNLGKASFNFNIAVTPDNKMFLIHQSNTNMLYFEYIDLTMGINPALYTKPVMDSVTLDYNPESVVVSKKYPSSCYIVVLNTFTSVYSIIKLNSDGSRTVIPNPPEMTGIAGIKLYVSRDGSVYLVFSKLIGTNLSLYVFELFE